MDQSSQQREWNSSSRSRKHSIFESGGATRIDCWVYLMDSGEDCYSLTTILAGLIDVHDVHKHTSHSFFTAKTCHTT